MALDIQLQQIASGAAGVYMLEQDNSNTPVITPDTRMRLFVVNIPKGRVNTIAQFAQGDSKGFISEFGDIDVKQERYGNYSVRSCLIGLENGPIAVLNLREFDDSLDKTGAIEISTKAGVANGVSRQIPYSQLFNTTRFWVIDAKNIIVPSSTKLLNFANIGDKKVTVFARKSKATGYDIRVSEYYAALNRPVPLNVDPEALFSDFMFDIYFFANDFSNPDKVQGNENYGGLFMKRSATDFGVFNEVTVRGQVLDGLDVLSQTADSGYITKVVGSAIPGSTTLDGTNMFIETLVNGAVAYQTGVIVKVNEDLMDAEGDWSPEDGPESDGQKRPIAVDLMGHGYFHIDAGGELVTPTFTDYFSYSCSTYAAQPLGFKYDKGEKSATYDPTKGTAQIDAILETPTKFVVASLFSIRAGDRVVGANGNLARVKNVNSIGEKIYLVGLHTTYPLQATGELFPKNGSGQYVYPTGHPNAGTVVAKNTTVPTTDPTYNYPLSAPGGAVIPLPTLTPQQIVTLKAEIGVKYVLMRVETVDPFIQLDKTSTSDMSGSITFEDGSTYSLVGKSIVGVYYFVTPNRYTSYYKGTTLDFYKARKAQFADGSNTTQTRVLNMLQQIGVRRSILEDSFAIRYIVDVFKSYIEPEIKSQLAALAKDKRVLALANFPFMKDFADSVNPYFKATPTGQLDTKYIITGGNRDLISSNVFSLPAYGDSNIAFFGPGLVANYYGQDVTVTPAASVSKAFINKFIAGQAFDLVANTDGIISGNNIKSLEYQFSDDERKDLEPYGCNPIIRRPNGAFAIYGNNTAQNRIRTALSKIHVRELVMLIQERMKLILAEYVFKFNNEATRAQVLARADGEMTLIRDNGGVIWFKNICDGNNNTQEVIEADMGILDTQIIPARAAEKWVHRTNLLSGQIVGFDLTQIQ